MSKCVYILYTQDFTKEGYILEVVSHYLEGIGALVKSVIPVNEVSTDANLKFIPDEKCYLERRLIKENEIRIRKVKMTDSEFERLKDLMNSYTEIQKKYSILDKFS